MNPSRYIAVEGPIGVGKTSLARRLAESLGGRLVLEDPGENPLLPDFYKDKRQHAFKAQLHFLLTRYEQQRELSLQEAPNTTLIFDYLFAKDRIFASINLTSDELLLYEKLYKILDEPIRKPDLVLYLHSETDVLIKNIKRRGIVYEQGIEAKYIEKLAKAYNEFFFSYTDTPLLVVNCSRIDFVHDEADYANLIREIKGMKKGQRQYIAVN